MDILQTLNYSNCTGGPYCLISIDVYSTSLQLRQPKVSCDVFVWRHERVEFILNSKYNIFILREETREFSANSRKFISVKYLMRDPSTEPFAKVSSFKVIEY